MWFRNIFNVKQESSLKDIAADGDASFSLSSQALNQLNRLVLNTSPTIMKSQTGSRSSHHRKPSADFLEHRQYVQGDDIRYVDWKASARDEHVFIKQGEHQKSVTIHILIDCSSSMQWGSPAKSTSALLLANALGYLSLAQRDRLIIIPVVSDAATESSRPLGPLWGKSQATQLTGYLQGISFQGQINLAEAMLGLSKRKMSRGGLVVVISDLLAAATLPLGLQALRSPVWKVVLLHLLHPDEINPKLNGHFELRDIETGEKKIYNITSQALETYRERLNTWQDRITQVCQENNAQYSVIPAGSSLEIEILPQLRRAQVVKSL